MVARNKASNITWMAKEIGVSNEALLQFSLGRSTLPVDKMQALTTIVFHGMAEFDPTLDRLRPVNTAKPVSQGSGPPPYVPRRTSRSTKWAR